MATHPSRHGRGVRGLPDRDEHAAEARRGRREAEAERRRGSRPPPSGTGVTTRATGFGGAASACERTPQASKLTNRLILPARNEAECLSKCDPYKASRQQVAHAFRPV